MNCATAWSAARPLLLAACAAFAAPLATAAVSCGIVSGTSTNFGAYDITSTAPADTVATLQVRCDSVEPGNPNITLTVTVGAGNGGSVNNRRLRHTGGSADVLNYGLFRDGSRSAVWGVTPGIDAMTQTVKVQNNRTAQALFTIYGRIPPLQDVTPGDYADLVQVTLSP
ncbi:MAG TPA: spore coat U domain-containing protein [Ramlibacter sp.]|uniref:Csu type fimbrial protein n=1 Tax=Ramlibacter sp. TaxID=1917967 RepID=UPI002ED5775A